MTKEELERKQLEMKARLKSKPVPRPKRRPKPDLSLMSPQERAVWEAQEKRRIQDRHNLVRRRKRRNRAKNAETQKAWRNRHSAEISQKSKAKRRAIWVAEERAREKQRQLPKTLEHALVLLEVRENEIDVLKIEIAKLHNRLQGRPMEEVKTQETSQALAPIPEQTEEEILLTEWKVRNADGTYRIVHRDKTGRIVKKEVATGLKARAQAREILSNTKPLDEIAAEAKSADLRTKVLVNIAKIAAETTDVKGLNAAVKAAEHLERVAGWEAEIKEDRDAANQPINVVVIPSLVGLPALEEKPRELKPTFADAEVIETNPAPAQPTQQPKKKTEEQLVLEAAEHESLIYLTVAEKAELEKQRVKK